MSIYQTAYQLDPVVASLLPKTFDEVSNIKNYLEGNTTTEEITIAVAKHSTTYRSVEWIRENGLCLDNLVPQPSKIRQAGNGAIAQRKISKGDIVVPVPLLHIVDKDTLKMSGDKYDSETTQLLMNYCFGHRDSTLLLCPGKDFIQYLF